MCFVGLVHFVKCVRATHTEYKNIILKPLFVENGYGKKTKIINICFCELATPNMTTVFNSYIVHHQIVQR